MYEELFRTKKQPSTRMSPYIFMKFVQAREMTNSLPCGGVF